MRQLITAELNVTRGSIVPAAVQTAIDGLRSYFAGNAATNTQISNWTTTLDNYNNGKFAGAPHCDD